MRRALTLLPPLLFTLACSGLWGPVVETDDLLGRADVTIPVPSANLARGFTGPGHRARVVDALCAGSIPVWGEVEQAVNTSHRQGETHDDITRRYTRLVQTCSQPAYCSRARSKLDVTDGEIHAFWMHVLATCGDAHDRVLFRNLDADANAVATFYTSGSPPPHREGADDGALIQATERLVQRGSVDEPLPSAIRVLLAHEHLEAAERLTALVPLAPLNVQDELYAGLAGQSHPDAIAAIEELCERVPDKGAICREQTKPPMPDHAAGWLRDLATATDPDHATGLIEAHPELRDQALPHLTACGPDCAGPASLLDEDHALFERADAAGIEARPDRVGRAAFDHDFAAVLHGRGRLTELPDAPSLPDRVARALVRLASPDLDDAEIHLLDPTEAGPAGVLALEISGRHFEVPLSGQPDQDLASTEALVNHALGVVDSSMRLRAAASGEYLALPDESVEALVAEGLIALEP